MSGSVRVGIVTRNRAKSLIKSIKSARQQSAPNLSIVVVDDGSSDATSAMPGQFPSVTWHRNEQSAGHVARRNELMRRGDFDYYVSLDDDAWFLGEDEVALAVDYLERNRRAAAVAFDILSPDRPEPRARTAPQPVATFIGCGHVLRLSAVHEVGLYQPSPGAYGGEEKDLCLRLMDAGYQIVRLPGVHVWHDKTEVGRALPEQHRSGVCNDLAMTLRRTPLIVLPVALLSKFYKHIIFSSRRGLLNPCLQGIGLFLRSTPEIWRSRRPVKLSTLREFVRLGRNS